MNKIPENLNMLKDIQTIDDLLNRYHQCGRIDRERAISKIIELRMTNSDIRAVTETMLPSNAIPFCQASSAQLADELNLYRGILYGNYLRNINENSRVNI